MTSTTAQPPDGSRLSLLLGPLKLLLTPRGALAACGLGWGLTAPFSSAPMAIGLCWWGVALLLWSLQLERPWLEVLPFPPLTVLALHLFLRWELGGIMLLLSRDGAGDVRVWVDHVAQALPINTLFTTALVAAGALNSRWLRQQPQPALAGQPRLEASTGFGKRQLLLLGVITGIVAIGYTGIGYFGGTLDRGAAYLQWAGKFWRPDTLFSATIRLRDLYFILLPWLVWSWRRTPVVVACFLVPTGASLLLSAVLGGRGLLLYPCLLLLGGLWLAGSRPQPLRWLMGITAALAFVVAAALPVLRHSAAFQHTEATNLGARLEAIQAGSRELEASQTLPLVGRDLYAWSDPYLFREPGLSQPPAGTKRLGNLLYLWAPQALMPNRPEVNDGHLIAKEIMGTPNAGTFEGRHVWFPGISLGADLYWRFRWTGVVVGSVLFGLAYAGFCRLWYQLADLHRNTASVLVALFPTTFLQGPPLRSLSETAWNWLYEFPKYLLILAIVCLIVEAVSRLAPGQAHAPEN
jgi:hypothetical protein